MQTNKIKMAASSIVQDGDRFLLIKRRNPPSQDMYAFPGGQLEDGEMPEQAALRELEEETGLKGTNAEKFAQYDIETGVMQLQIHVFKVNVTNLEDAKAQDDAKELDWFTLQETIDLPMPQTMIDCFNLIEEQAINQS